MASEALYDEVTLQRARRAVHRLSEDPLGVVMRPEPGYLQFVSGFVLHVFENLFFFVPLLTSSLCRGFLMTAMPRSLHFPKSRPLIARPTRGRSGGRTRRPRGRNGSSGGGRSLKT